ncbi:MAG: VCBS repeat-containing protein [Ignavibacteria bacterium]|nr:VCBS repeat-containing protein [Ignavibacteria bacterium]
MKKNLTISKMLNSGANFQKAGKFKKNRNTRLQNSCKSLIAVLISSMLSFFAVALNAQVITSFTPESGPVGTIVTISGSGFNTTPANNIVFFGAVMSAVTGSTTTSITTTVPAGADYRNISVTNLSNNLTAYSSKPFNVTFPGGCKFNFADKVDFVTGAGGQNSISVASSDIDGDGKTDMAVANYATNSVSVFRNTSTNGTVSFEPKINFTTGSQPIFVNFGDLNGDGKPDMAVANNLSSVISVYRNNSTSGVISFAAKRDFTGQFGNNSIDIGDFNSDGKPDIAAANSGNICLFRNTTTSSTITFASRVNLSTGTSPKSVTVADIDGDGKPDIVNTNAGDDNVSVFRNTTTGGSISFAASVNFATEDVPRFIKVVDLDGDGKPDIAAVYYNSAPGDLTLLRNISVPGTINFEAKINVPSGSNSISLSIGDIDGDGKPDLAAINNVTSYLSVYHNESQPGLLNFEISTDNITESGCEALVIGDIDNDNKPDISVVNGSSNELSVFLNTGSFQTGLTGNGNSIPFGSITPDEANHTDFGSSSVRTFTFQNSGSDSLSVSSITMTGTDSSLFTAGALTPPGKIAPGGSAAFTVTFAPISSGIKTAKVNIFSINSCSQQIFSYAVRGGAVNIKVIPEGFYNASSNLILRDTVTINLRDTISPYPIVDTYKALLTASGSAIVSFPNAVNGKKYFLQLTHRNSIETWSVITNAFVNGSLTYNFSTAITQAFGNNLKQVDASPVVFAIFSGDVNQDGTIDASDVSDADNDAFNSVSGYVSTDVTGDDFVDAADVSIVDNNAFNAVSAVTP